MKAAQVTPDMDIINCARIRERIADLQGAAIDGQLTTDQGIELAALRELAPQLLDLEGDADYPALVMYRQGVEPPAGPGEDEDWLDFSGPPFRWVTFGGTPYLAIARSET